MKGIVIGKGEVGTALYNVLKNTHETYIRDVSPTTVLDAEILHICFPWNYDFQTAVMKYIREYEPKYVVIHSTLYPKTTELIQYRINQAKLKSKMFFSPVRGVHPNLEEGIKTFVKYLAPKNKKLAKYFEEAGIKVEQHKHPRTIETAKVMSTTYYGWNIIFEKLLYKYCKRFEVDYDLIYTKWNETYNEGYEKLGMPNVKRSILKHAKGKIGGHCVIPNLKLVAFDPAIFIKKFNEKVKRN